MKPVELQFEGAVRIAEGAPGLGVALFRQGRGNIWYIGECDRFLRIARFVEFDDFEGYSIEYGLPDEWKGRTVSIGEALPIPYWRGWGLQVAPGDGNPEHYGRQWDNGRHEVDDRLQQVLEKARNGRLVSLGEPYQEDLFESSFEDIFKGKPAFSHYWVARYNMAYRQYPDVSYRLKSLLRDRRIEWLDRFARKADLKKIKNILPKDGSAVYPGLDAADVMYAVVVDRLARRQFGHLLQYATDPLFQRMMPDGVAAYYEKRGWPRKLFRLTVPQHFHEPMFEVIAEAEKYEFAENEWKIAEGIALLMYGQNLAPVAVQERVALEIADAQDSILEQLGSMHLKSRRDFEINSVPPEIVQKYNSLVRMCRIHDGGDRMQQVPRAVSLEEIAQAVDFYIPPEPEPTKVRIWRG